MIFEIEINNKPVKVKRGETILEVLNRTGIKVPTLCSMKGFTPTGMCRMCVVEIEGKDNLIPSCSFKVEEWMKIKTHSPKVVQARKAIVELLLANHPDDCLFCERNGNCELQKHAEDLHVRERRIVGKKHIYSTDKSSVSVVFEQSKCILCGRCIRVCNESIGVSTLDFSYRGVKTSVKAAMSKAFGASNCVHCGQCIMVCPTAALSEKINFSELQVFFHDPAKKMVATYSPAVAITIAEEFGIKPGRDINAIIQTVLRKIGFDTVLDSSFGTDLMIMEKVTELMQRLKDGGPFPMYSSCCPSWVEYAEHTSNKLIGNLTSVKSTQQLAGVVAKSYLAELEKINIENIHVVSIVPCTSKKYEATRPEMSSGGVPDVDAVITTRELLRMIKMYGIDVTSIEPDPVKNYFNSVSTAGKLVNVSGGTAEAMIRSLYSSIVGKEIQENKISPLRGNKGIKEAKIKMGNHELGFAVVNGLGNAKQLLAEIEAGRNDLHYIEIMACQGGCIAGGGQPIEQQEDNIKQRQKNIYESDEKDIIRAAHLNTQMLEMYGKSFGKHANHCVVFKKKEVFI